jgi:hypothetical protein
VVSSSVPKKMVAEKTLLYPYLLTGKIYSRTSGVTLQGVASADYEFRRAHTYI